MYESEREVALNRIQAKIALSLADTREAALEVVDQWNRYVHLTYGTEDTKLSQEIDMQAEYENYKTLKPTLVREKDGSVKVRGLGKLDGGRQQQHLPNASR